MRPSDIGNETAVQFITLAHSVSTLVLVLLEANVVHVTVCQFVSNVPFVRVIAAPILNASCSVQAHPTPLNANPDAIVTQARVIVFHEEVEENVIVPVYVLTSVAYRVKLP